MLMGSVPAPPGLRTAIQARGSARKSREPGSWSTDSQMSKPAPIRVRAAIGACVGAFRIARAAPRDIAAHKSTATLIVGG